MRLLLHMLSDYIVIKIVNRLLMQNLLYVLPDIKPKKHPMVKIKVKLLSKIVINAVWEIEYWAKYSTTIDPCEKSFQ